jgi:hypothetical protein
MPALVKMPMVDSRIGFLSGVSLGGSKKVGGDKPSEPLIPSSIGRS